MIKEKATELLNNIKNLFEKVEDVETPETSEVEVTIEDRVKVLEDLVIKLQEKIDEMNKVEEPEVKVDKDVETEMSIINLASIFEINKWEVVVTQDTFEVGTKITYNYEGVEYSISDGEYLLENGDKIQVDADGVIVLYTKKDETTTEPTTEPVVETEMSKVDEKDERIKELEAKLLEMSKQPETQPIQLEKQTINKKTFAQEQIEHITNVRKSKGLSY